MRYESCADCGKEKIGRNRQRERCRSCAQKINNPKITPIYDFCTNCGVKKTGVKRASQRCRKCSMKGYTLGPQSLEHRQNNSLTQGGDGDLENRKYPGLSRWARLVKERDGRCTMCRTTEELEAHHIIPKATQPDLHAVLENGLTLCAGCHRLEPWAIHKQPMPSGLPSSTCISNTRLA